MVRRWIRLLCVVASAAFGQQAPTAGSPGATFRTTTKLIQVSVVAQDKQGKPVLDLRRDDFQIFDNGSPQNIQLFLAETEKSNFVAPEAGARNTFTNRIASPAGSHNGYSVILIDNLFTIFGDPDKEPGGRALARLQALRMLRSIPSGEKIAIYAVGRKFAVICEFTSDRDLLERQLTAWTPSVDAPATSGEILGDPLNSDETAINFHAAAAREAVRIDAVQRASASNDEMRALADHLAGIPGRKNLIWLSTRFVMGPALRKFSDANVAIYPIDLDGVCGGPDDPQIPCPPRPKELMDNIAAQTGGRAFYSRNDLDIAMREAMDDGRISYTLGFYQPGDETKATVHQLAVRVDRPGVTLRYRTSYQTEPPPPVSTSPVSDLVTTMNRPMDATAIPISASATRIKDRLDLKLSFDVSSLGLDLSNGLWEGQVELVARFITADGIRAGDVFSQTLALTLRPATYASMLQSGFPYHKEIGIPAKAVELKVLVGNLASGKIGTLTIPLSEVQPGAAR